MYRVERTWVVDPEDVSVLDADARALAHAGHVLPVLPRRPGAATLHRPRRARDDTAAAVHTGPLSKCRVSGAPQIVVGSVLYPEEIRRARRTEVRALMELGKRSERRLYDACNDSGGVVWCARVPDGRRRVGADDNDVRKPRSSRSSRWMATSSSSSCPKAPGN